MKTYERGPFHRSEAHARFVESPQQPYAAAVFSARDRRGADALAAKCRLPNLIPAGPWRPCTGIGACKPWRRPAQRIHMTERCHRCANPSCCTVGRFRSITACLKYIQQSIVRWPMLVAQTPHPNHSAPNSSRTCRCALSTRQGHRCGFGDAGN